MSTNYLTIIASSGMGTLTDYIAGIKIKCQPLLGSILVLLLVFPSYGNSVNPLSQLKTIKDLPSNQEDSSEIKYTPGLNESFEAMKSWRAIANSHFVKIAILDKGFKGLHKTIARHKDFRIISHSTPKRTESEHGTKLLDVFIDIAKRGLHNSKKLEVHLFRAKNFEEFQRSLEQVQNKNFQVLVYAQVWPSLASASGSGMIEQIVDTTLKKKPKLLWFNASGNFNDRVIVRPITKKLPTDIKLYCEKPCRGEVHLNWARSTSTDSPGDLDFFLTNSMGKVLSVSNQRQVPLSTQKRTSEPKNRNHTFMRNDHIKINLPAGTYSIGLVNRSKDFNTSDFLWLSLKSRQTSKLTSLTNSEPPESKVSMQLLESQEFANSKLQPMFPPANHPMVITVGASDYKFSSFNQLIGKPEILAPSLTQFKHGTSLKGSSLSTAIVAASAAVFLSHNGHRSKDELLRIFSGHLPRSQLNSHWFLFPNFGDFLKHD